jgi:CBS domain-containing protein
VKVKDILKDKGSKVATIGMEDTTYDAVKKLVEKNIGSLLVLDEKGGIAGIITERDILKECDQRFQSLDKTKVKDVMSKKLIVASPDDDVDYVENVMTENRIRHLPIVSGEKLEGIISIGDLVNVQRAQCKVENRYLKAYISGEYPG